MDQTVDVMDVLAARDRRVQRQQELLAAYAKPLISFTMNIAGPVKRTALIERGFELGLARLEGQLRACRAAVEAILDNRLLKSHGVLVLESGEPDPLGVDTPLAAKFEVQKTARYGVDYVTILVAKK